MSKSSPLKHKGDHGMYIDEEAYHKANGGEVATELDASDIAPSLMPLPTDPIPVVTERQKQLDDAKAAREKEIKDAAEAKELQVASSKIDIAKKYNVTPEQVLAQSKTLKDEKNLLKEIEKVDDVENIEAAQEQELNHIQKSFGYYKDGVYIPGKRKEEENRINSELSKLNVPPDMQTGELSTLGLPENKGMYNPDSNPVYFLNLEKEKLDNNEKFAKNVRFDVLDKALLQASIFDFAVQNKIDVKDVDQTSKEFKESRYTRKDLEENEDLYDRVINGEYKKIAAQVGNTKKKEKIITEHYEKEFKESGGVYKTKGQKEANAWATKALDKYAPVLDGIAKTSGDMANKMADISKSIHTDGMWLKENDPAKDLKRLKEKKYTTQEEVDAANREYADIVEKYNGVLNRMNANIGSNQAYRTTINKALESAESIQAKTENLELIKDLSGDYYGHMFNISSRAIAATAEFVEGADELTKRFNVFKAIDPEDIPDIFKPALEYAQNSSLLNNDIARGIGTLTGMEDDFIRKGLNDFSKNLRGSQRDYEDQNWGIRTIMDMAEMYPQLLTGMTGIGMMGNYGIMAGTSTGNSFVRFEEEGLKGWNLYSTASFHGAMEGVSEMVTSKFGSRALMNAANPSLWAGEGIRKYTKGFLGLGAYTAEESGIEGLSEGINTFSTNLWDKFVRKKDLNLMEGVSESFWKGASVSVGFKGPMITKAIFRPFIPKATNVKLAQIAETMRVNSDRLLDPNLKKETKEKIKLEQKRLVEKSNKIYDKSITMTATIPEVERKELMDIEVKGYNIQKDHNEILTNNDMSKEDKDKALKELEAEYHELAKNKKDILDKYQNTSDKDRLKNWNDQVETIKQMSKMAEQEGAAPINIKETDTKGMEDFMLREDAADITFAEGTVRALREIVQDPSSTQEQVNEANEMLQQYKKQKPVQQHLNMIKGDASNYGVMVPQFNEKGEVTSYDLLLNKETSLENGMLNTAAHEFIHAAFYNTLKQDPAAQRVLGSALLDVIQSDKNVKYTDKGMDIMNRRLASYGANFGEEAFAIASELMLDGDLTFNEKGLNKLKGIFRRFAQNHLGRDIKFNTKKDVKNFMIDYHKSVANNKPSPAIAKMLAKGAKGNLVQHAQTPVERQRERDFSKAIQLNLKSNPDLRSDIDGNVKNEDGTPKFVNDAEFKNSPEYINAYEQIATSKLLDGLIKQGMIEQGLPPAAMKDFTQKVKDKLGMRFATNYNLDKNDSLFGWLTGVSGGMGKSIIYRAKGDVMVQYTKENQNEKTSLDKPVGEAGTLADILPAERSAEMEAFEIQDLSAGRRNAYVQGPIPVLDQFEMTSTKENVDDAISKVQNKNETRVDLDGLTYKGVKKLLTDTKKVDKNGKMKSPTKVSDVTPTGPLYNVLKEVAQAIGVDPKRILANQDLDAKQRKAAKQFLYSKIVNKDGSYNETFLDEVLPEGETRSGESTGIANTKLGLLYEKGDRAKFAEGATAAGKPTQTKRTDVTMDEILGVFGINPDGTFQSGTGSDGAIRQAILSTAQLAANQGLREHALKNGTHPESVIAQLGDGRALRAFSKALPPKLVRKTMPDIESGWNELIHAVAGTDLSKNQLTNAIESVYGKSFKNKGKILKILETDLKGFVELTPDVRDAVESIVDMNAAPSTLTEHLQEAFTARQSELVLKNKLGFSGSVADIFNDALGLTKQRANLTEVTGDMVGNLGVVEAGELLIAHVSGGFASSGSLGNSQLFQPSKPGGEVIPILEILRSARQGYQSTAGIADFVALLNNANVDSKFKKDGQWIRQKSQGKYEVYDGSNWVAINTTLLKENVAAGLKDKNYEARQKQSMDARRVSKIMLDAAWLKVKDPKNPFNKKDFAALMTQLGSGMESPLRRSAPLSGIQQGIEGVIARGKKRGEKMKDIVRYEHATSKQEINSRIVDSYTSSNTLNDNVWNGYQVNIISGALDNVMNAVGYKTQSPTQAGFNRMFNPRILRHVFANANNIDLKDIGVIESINPKDRGTANEFLGQDYVDAINTFVDIRNNDQLAPQIIGKAISNARMFSRPGVNPKGISVLDFDDTLAFSNSEVISTSPDGTVRKLTAEQFATEGADLLDQGWKHDFSEFNKVVDGRVADLFQKALKLQKKFGNKNMFVLTARPAESAQSIFEFLKANGLNIPLKNITGLANSTAEAKALWIADKVGEGYNDFYFADDALQNVKAVKEMLDQFDVKSKVQQAKRQFSKDAGKKFNDILEQTTNVKSEKVFSDAQAKLRGSKTKYKSIIPASAQDFAGLIYNFLGKGKIGETQMEFFKKSLIDPFARAINELNASRQSAANDYKNLQKAFPDVKKLLKESVEGMDYTYDQAARVYLWNKAGFEVPGLSQRDLKSLIEVVESNPKLQAYAEAVGKISKKEAGYSQPNDYWLAETIASDLLSDGAVGDARADFLAEWKSNVDLIFNKENLNKIQAIYGANFREALEDSLYRMETGRNRPTGSSRMMSNYMNWVNNSVGAIMFFNMRSAILQTMSATNYINWSDNNPLKAAAAFANQPQYWKDFARLFNSPYLKQRRAGNQRGINEAELSDAVAGSDNKAKAAIAWLLKKGFLPTQIADSFAISSGGATFFRNRVNKYIKEGMTQEQADKQAFLDFQETTEVAQQSARPDMISQQQASPLGRLILSFQNTPMQYARIMNKAARDLVNGRGDAKTHISKMAYYGVVQSIIFGSLQSALFAALGEDEEEEFDKKKERILNGMIDSVLSGIGYGGKAVSTVKNTIKTYLEQRDKGFRADHTYTILTILGFSPPIGSKLRKIYSSIQTEKFNQGVFEKRGLTLDNPIWSGIGNVIEGVTNVPLGRVSQKMLNLDNAMDSNNEWWQRVALVLGWNTWDLGIRDKDIEAVKTEIKEEKKVESKKKAIIKKEAKKEETRQKNKSVIKENQEKSKKDGICSAISKGGKRCKSKAVNGGFCTVHEKKEQNSTGKKTQCKKVKKGDKRCKMQTSNKSGYCYYHD